MASKRIDSYNDVLHAAGLWTTPNGVIGRAVMIRVGRKVASAQIVSCFIDEFVMELGLSLEYFDGRRVDALIFNAAIKAWKLRFRKSRSLAIDYTEFTAS